MIQRRGHMTQECITQLLLTGEVQCYQHTVPARTSLTTVFCPWWTRHTKTAPGDVTDLKYSWLHRRWSRNINDVNYVLKIWTTRPEVPSIAQHIDIEPMGNAIRNTKVRVYILPCTYTPGTSTIILIPHQGVQHRFWIILMVFKNQESSTLFLVNFFSFHISLIMWYNFFIW